MFGAAGTVCAADADGRYRLTGRWAFTSNCRHADHIGLGAWFKQDPDAEPELVPRLVFVPTSRIEIHDTWGGLGLRGTSSHDTSVDGIEVDRSWSCSFGDAAWVYEPMWRIPLFSVLAPPLAGVLLGIARGTVDEVSEMAAKGGRSRLSDR